MARVLGLDVGERRVGVALSDAGASVASPLLTLANRGVRALVAEIVALCGERQVELVVVGVPLQADGSAGPAARLPRRVAAALTAAGLSATLWDESDTSAAAKRILRGNVSARSARGRGLVDRMAAALILQSYLERGCAVPQPCR